MQGYTIRRATEKKEQTRGQFRAAREKETAKRDQRKSDTNITIELEALKVGPVLSLLSVMFCVL